VKVIMSRFIGFTQNLYPNTLLEDLKRSIPEFLQKVEHLPSRVIVLAGSVPDELIGTHSILGIEITITTVWNDDSEKPDTGFFVIR